MKSQRTKLAVLRTRIKTVLGAELAALIHQYEIEQAHDKHGDDLTGICEFLSEYYLIKNTETQEPAIKTQYLRLAERLESWLECRHAEWVLCLSDTNEIRNVMKTISLGYVTADDSLSRAMARHIVENATG